VDNNDVLRRLRYALQLDDAAAAKLVVLGGESATAELAARWRLQDSAAEFITCDDTVLRALLAGLITDRRGARAAPTVGQSSPAVTLDNNLILKQLKIALSMRTQDIQQAVQAGGGSHSDSEIGALLRKFGSRNYRRCGDQVLRQFLSGLAALRRD
jgi:uncharacterized protein YehS (DUF1456 family)